MAKLLVVLIISSRWVRPSLLTKDFLEKESDILKSHTNILSLITHLEELESSAKDVGTILKEIIVHVK